MHVRAQGHNVSYSMGIIAITVTPVLTHVLRMHQGYGLQTISQPKLDLNVQELAQP